MTLASILIAYREYEKCSSYQREPLGLSCHAHDPLMGTEWQKSLDPKTGSGSRERPLRKILGYWELFNLPIPGVLFKACHSSHPSLYQEGVARSFGVTGVQIGRIDRNSPLPRKWPCLTDDSDKLSAGCELIHELSWGSSALEY